MCHQGGGGVMLLTEIVDNTLFRLLQVTEGIKLKAQM